MIIVEPVGTMGGGAEVNVIDVPETATGAGTRDVLTVPVPAGVQAVVCVGLRATVIASSNAGGSSGSQIRLTTGGSTQQTLSMKLPPEAYYYMGCQAETTGPAVLSVYRSTSNSASQGTVVGKIYWWEKQVKQAKLTVTDNQFSIMLFGPNTAAGDTDIIDSYVVVSEDKAGRDVKFKVPVTADKNVQTAPNYDTVTPGTVIPVGTIVRAETDIGTTVTFTAQ